MYDLELDAHMMELNQAFDDYLNDPEFWSSGYRYILALTQEQERMMQDVRFNL